jgi:hypothetical protein
MKAKGAVVIAGKVTVVQQKPTDKGALLAESKDVQCLLLCCIVQPCLSSRLGMSH